MSPAPSLSPTRPRSTASMSPVARRRTRRKSIFGDSQILEILSIDTWLILHQLDLPAAVSARVKRPESLAAKARRKGIAPDAVLDRLALRVCVKEVSDCYSVFHRICSQWTPVADSQDDYIAQPKANGYQSLHTAVWTPFGPVEFQVRTHAMDAYAEAGGASHAAYKARLASA